MQQEVLEFINRRWKNDANWINGNCYWFAYILSTRFPYLNIYYCSSSGHFVAGIQNTYYDWTGLVYTDEVPILLDDIKKTDILWYEHLMRDCKD